MLGLAHLCTTEPPVGAVGAFDGLVASREFGSTLVFVSPNQKFIPEFAVAHNEITTFADGHWGLHEYSQWPQPYNNQLPHVPCIPRQGSVLAPAETILWRRWEDIDWVDKDTGLPRFGLMNTSLMHELHQAAEHQIDRAYGMQDIGDRSGPIRHFLTICLRNCLDHLQILPAPHGITIALAAHVQRLMLELAGLCTYVLHVRPRIEQQHDHRTNVLGVAGAHTYDPSVAQMLHMAGVPVWFQQQFTRDIPIWQVVTPKWLPFHFSSTPAFPRLVLAVRDLSGALNTAGKWQRAMTAEVHRQLLASRLPSLMREAKADGPSESKRP